MVLVWLLSAPITGRIHLCANRQNGYQRAFLLCKYFASFYVFVPFSNYIIFLYFARSALGVMQVSQSGRNKGLPSLIK